MIDLDVTLYIHIDKDEKPFASTVNLLNMGYPLINKMPLVVQVDVDLADIRSVRIKNLECMRDLKMREHEKQMAKINMEIQGCWKEV